MNLLSRQFAILLLTGALAALLPGCDKDDDPPARDYTELFKNTIWTGEYKQDSASQPKPYSMEFVVGNAAIFHDCYGDFVGSYTLQNNRINVSIPSLSAKFSAVITDENTFTDIKNTGTISWSLMSGEYNVLTGQDLDNTFWKGIYGSRYNIELEFRPGNRVTLLSDLRPTPETYTRKAGYLRCSFTGGKAFMVLQNNTTQIKGVWAENYPFTATRQ